MSASQDFWAQYVDLPGSIPEGYLQPGEWQADLLGPGFEAISLELPRDEEGELPATLVRHLPAADPHRIPGTPDRGGFVFLYMHGWNDYFYQREMARHVSLAGGYFFALDLSKYGRSWRPWQTFGWTEDVLGYDLDLAAALEQIRKLHPDLPLLLSGHSTGGLVACYWAMRNRAQLSALLLTSPWIEMPKGMIQRKTAFTAGNLLGRRRGRTPLPMRRDSDSTYQVSLEGWNPKYDGQLPEELIRWKADPSISGWNLVPQWKGTQNSVVRIGWLGAIAKAQQSVLHSKPLNLPVYFYTSTQSYEGKRNRKAMYADTVLNVETLCSAAWKLSTQLTLERYRGKHDPMLSFPPIRKEIWMGMHRWFARFVPGATDLSQLPDTSLRAICP